MNQLPMNTDPLGTDPLFREFMDVFKKVQDCAAGIRCERCLTLLTDDEISASAPRSQVVEMEFVDGSKLDVEYPEPVLCKKCK